MKVLSFRTETKNFSHINGKEEALEKLGNPKEPVFLTVEHQGEQVEVTWTPESEDGEKEGYWDYDGSMETFDDWKSAVDTFVVNKNG